MKRILTAAVGVVLLLGIGTAAARTEQPNARGGFGEWPVSRSV